LGLTEFSSSSAPCLVNPTCQPLHPVLLPASRRIQTRVRCSAQPALRH
jgi:hypothetical protein